jgi:DNA-binding MarR family transcriptional regulator
LSDRLPLSALLSQALVAYTIEFDDEAERRVPHGTTVGGLAGIRAGGVWFTSQVMWTNFIRHISKDSRPVREVQALACLSENAVKSRLHHLEWWHYLTFAPDPKDTRAKPRYLDLLVKLTPNGELAAKAWTPIAAEIDKRWTKRFGKASVDKLMKALRTIVGAEAADLPDYMPVVGYGDGMRATLVMPEESPKRTPSAKLDLSALLSRALLAATLEFEQSSDISLTVAANVLRVVEEGGASLKDLPLRAGVAKEGVVAAVNFLKKKGFASLGTDKAKTVKLTAKGKKARADYARSLSAIEKRWEKTFGKQTVHTLRKSLEELTGHTKFVEGLEPHDGGWRLNKRYIAQTNAVLADPRGALPQHPMITHRGGFPDGC